ncbi:MAG: hypothetical protein V2I43_15005, partial [Parvularcula sp.]|nr:hypothetical protein [Parvularcula sp.]
MLVALLALLSFQPGDAEPYRDCAGIERDQARLACFDAAASKDQVLAARKQVASDQLASDQLVSQMAAEREAQEAKRMQLEEARQRAAVLEERAREAEAQLAAAEARAAKAERDLNPIPSEFTAKILRKRFNPRGALVVQLEDG